MKKIILLCFLLGLIVLVPTCFADNLYILSGTINSSQSLQLDRPSFIGQFTNYNEEIAANNDYSVSFYSGATELKKNYFDVQPTNYSEVPYYFDFSVAIPNNTKTIVFKHLSNVIGTKNISNHVPSISHLSVVHTGNNYLTSWSASDADNDNLTYYVSYSVNNQGFIPFLLDYPNKTLNISSNLFPAGQIILKVQAFDGFNIAELNSNAFTATDVRPYVYIYYPNTESVFTNGSVVDLMGGVFDPDSQNMTFSWTSNIDGNLGNTSYLSANLSTGNHVITFSANDGELSSQDSINISIVNDTRPDLSIVSLSSVPESPEIGSNVTIKASIFNKLTDSFFSYSFFNGNPSQGGVLISGGNSFVSANSFFDVSTVFGSMSSGYSNIYLKIYNVTPIESNTINNIANQTIYFSPLCGGADATDNGIVDGGDLNVLLANWNKNCSSSDCSGADITNNGIVDGGDLNVLLANWNRACGVIESPVTGAGAAYNVADITKNGIVDGGDMNLLLANWNKNCSSPSWCNGSDITKNGIVDGGDMNLLLANWNKASNLTGQTSGSVNAASAQTTGNAVVTVAVKSPVKNQAITQTPELTQATAIATVSKVASNKLSGAKANAVIMKSNYSAKSFTPYWQVKWKNKVWIVTNNKTVVETK
jgi:hypothetical protein